MENKSDHKMGQTLEATMTNRWQSLKENTSLKSMLWAHALVKIIEKGQEGITSTESFRRAPIRDDK